MSLLKLFLLWFFLSSLRADSVTQSFSRVATYYDQVSSGHLGVSVDFEGFDHYLGLLEKAMVRLTSADRGVFGTTPVLARLGAVIAEVRQRHDQYQSFFSGNVATRGKRQLGAVLGIGLGLAALYDVEDLRGTVGQLQSRQNDMVRILGCVTNDTARLTKNFNRLHAAMVKMESVDASIQHVLEVESAVLEISGLANKLFSGLDGALRGHLSFELVHDQEVRDQFHALREAAFAQGFGTVFASYTQIFQLPASFLAEKGLVHVVVDVPLVPLQEYQEFDLLSFNSVPFLLGDHLVRVKPSTDLLAVNRDKSRFMEVSHGDIKDCLSIGRSVLCHYKNVVLSGSSQTCLRALYEGGAESIFRFCPLTFLKADFILDRINATAFYSFANESVPGSVTCSGRRTQVTFQGYHVHNLAPGCVVFAHGYTFVAAYDPIIRVPDVLTSFSPPKSVVDHFSNFTNKISAALAHFDYVDFNALLEGGEELGRMVPWIPTSGHLWWIGGSIAGLGTCAGLLFFAFRYRILDELVERFIPGIRGLPAVPEEAPLSRWQVERVAKGIQCHLSPPPPLPRASSVTSSWDRLRGLAISPPGSRASSESDFEVEQGFGRGQPPRCQDRRPGTVRVDASRVPLLGALPPRFPENGDQEDAEE